MWMERKRRIFEGARNEEVDLLWDKVCCPPPPLGIVSSEFRDMQSLMVGML